MTSEFQATPSHLRSLQKYRLKAKIYDSTTDGTNTIRHRTIGHLDLKPGEVVLDVGCGSGVSFPLLMHAVGATGTILGFDQSPEMLALAHRKCAENGWTNVHLQNAFAESVRLPFRPNAILLHYTHDILQSPQAIDNLLAQAAPGARISIAGMKNFAWWTGPLTLLSFCKNYAWNGNPRGLWRPWRLIEPHLTDYRWRSTQWGMGYMASGSVVRVGGERHARDQSDHRAQ
jgi:arsenite methyltransferase